MTPDGERPPADPEAAAQRAREAADQRAREVALRRAEEALRRRQAALRPGGPIEPPTLVDGAPGAAGPDGSGAAGEVGPRKRRADRRTKILALSATVLLLSGLFVGAGTFFFDQVPTPAELELPESTTVFYADGKTPMATLGSENRTLLRYDEMNDAVKQSIVAAEDQTYWTNEGIDFKGVLRAAWNNVTGGDTQGASTITQQYARVAAKLKGVTYSRKLREAIIAWKLADKYSKEQILEFYLNTVPFGRGAYGIEAASQAFLGKTANKNAPAAQQVTMAEAMVLVSMVKQPEANPDNPEGAPGYDPTRNELALQNSKDRWSYVREGLVRTGALTRAQADALTYPDTVKKDDPTTRQSGLDLPTGIVVSHVLSELRQNDRFKNKGPDYIANGGFRIITTIDKGAQAAAEEAADITRPTAPDVVKGQPANWQAALVAVEPGTGRVLAFFGGKEGTGSDYAGWYYDIDGNARGFGQHPPGSSFKVYDLAEALRQDIRLDSRWDSPATKEFPASGRVKGTEAGPVRNASSSSCQPNCTLTQATVASLNVPFFDLTEHLGAGNVIEMAAKAGVDSMWANGTGPDGKPAAIRVDLRGKPAAEVAGKFSTEVGIGQYGITVVDHANGMATFAADGKRAQAHFVRAVELDGDTIYEENLTQTDIGLGADKIADLDATLNQVTAGAFSKDWDAAAKTGTWQYGRTTDQNAHVWTVGYTRAIAAAVWIGTKDGGPLVVSPGKQRAQGEVFGGTYAAPIWRQFMANATKAMNLDTANARFAKPKPSPTPEQSEEPTPEPTETEEENQPSPEPTPPPTGAPEPTLPPASPPAPSLSPLAELSGLGPDRAGRSR